MILPYNTSEILEYMGLSDRAQVSDPLDGTGPKIKWKDDVAFVTDEEIIDAIPEFETDQAAKKTAHAAKKASMPTYEELVARVIALEAKAGGK